MKRFWAGCVLAVVTGCSGGVSADKACADQAAGRCAKFDLCEADAGVLVRYGDLPTCLSREKSACVAGLSAPSINRTPQQVEDCVTATQAESCVDFFTGNTPAACQPVPGKLANGASCAFNAECQSTFCALARASACGTCQTRPTSAGMDCTATVSCGYNQACSVFASDAGVVTHGTCELFVASGGSCDRYHLCDTGYSCVGSSALADGGTIQGTCQARATSLGASCDVRQATAASCDPNAGLFCDGQTGTCAALTNVGPGNNCVTSVDAGVSTAFRCTGGAACGPPSSTTRTCVAPAADGAACDSATATPCLPPARCVLTSPAGTAGVCTLPDSTKCL